MNIKMIKQLSASGSLRWTDHALERMLKRGISREEIKHILANGEIIEEYHKDYPFPSCLIYGETCNESPLHVVCGIGDDELWIITSYFPDLLKWNIDYKTRRTKS